ncbi:hypothetical protein PHYSODRAFT_254221 [Phytophthora sojae]|uniref:Uncharacterized protein n=1 Tax=Phytophthora sojae (strain P6497) TaxID=1094619 RepID=G5A8V4_PHYSP|nr:hypothetical protein PHYSODRAFT_254221 [Phytophthora sojae]EGZ08330.1 hypothetical protein PHYSODRAFT_254221 [Phytophthora sojae]|eukprot:XP_009536502.1 hypothetical protein PHYSODRAFT_254221 [Phytophthora sojae]
MSDVDRLLALVEKMLPLGKDEWERLAMTYIANAVRPRETTRAFGPTGVQETPPHIKKAKVVKLAVDAKANVVEMDAVADDDQPDFCFEVDPDDSLPTGGESLGSDESLNDESTVYSRSTSRGEFQDLLTSPPGMEGFDDLAHTPHPAPGRAGPSARRSGSGGPPPSRKAAVNATSGEASLPTQQPATQAAAAVSRDDLEAARYPKLQTSSNRLGGTDLSSFRDTIGVKRAREDKKDTAEASYAKAKRIRAMKATTALKSKLDGIESNSSSMRGSILETLLVLREESERKAKARLS